MKNKRFLSLALAVLMAAAVLSGCGPSAPANTPGGTPEPPPENKHIVFANCGWDSNQLHNVIAGFVAEHAFGYTWEEVLLSTNVMLQGMEGGDIDVDMEIWSDQIDYYDTFISSGKVTELGTNFDDSEQGIYVPRYVIEGDSERNIEALAPDLKTVADLKDYADIFPDDDDPSKGRIYSYVAGSATNEVIQSKIKYYGLDEMYNGFAPGSDVLLSTAIVSAYERGEPIATYYWSPTWLMGKYDFVLLEDAPYDEAAFYDGATAFPPCDVTIVVNNEFMDTNPEFCEFLSKYKTTSSFANEALAYMQDTDSDINTAALWLMQQNTDLFDEWLTPEQAQAVKDAL